ncbi:hypothetical protein AMECASPLE_008342, partial [Ameca splendens]
VSPKHGLYGAGSIGRVSPFATPNASSVRRTISSIVPHQNYFNSCIIIIIRAVELENLPLRKDALREFDLPFEVKAGQNPLTDDFTKFMCNQQVG